MPSVSLLILFVLSIFHVVPWNAVGAGVEPGAKGNISSVQALVEANVVQEQDVVEFVMGIYGGMTSISLTYLATSVMFDLDFRKNFDANLRARFGPPIIAVPNLNPRLRFKVQIGTCNSNAVIGLRTSLDFILGLNGQTPIAGLVGGLHSSISMPVATLCSAMEVPKVSWGSTSPKLSNKATYPYFFRTIPPDTIQGSGFYAWMVRFLVPKAIFYYQTDAYGEGLWGAVAAAAARDGRQNTALYGQPVEYMPSGYSNATALAALQVGLREGKSKFLLLAMTADQATPFMMLMCDYELMSASYQVFASEAVFPVPPWSWLNIPVGFMKLSPINHGQLYSKFEDMWRRMRAEDVLGAGPRALYNIDRMYVQPESGKATMLTDATFSTTATIQEHDPFLFDACYSFVVAVNNMLNRGVSIANIKGEALKEELAKTKFEGISGPIAFDASYDRLGSYVILNQVPVAGTDAKEVAHMAVYDAGTNIITLKNNSLGPFWMDGQQSGTAPDHFVSCDIGQYADKNRLCQDCPRGRFSIGGVIAECTACPPGSIADAPGLSTCTLCGPGTVASESASRACNPCELGTYAGETGLSVCMRCDQGTYADRRGSRNCTTCLGGRTTELRASNSPLDCGCAAGTFLRAANQDCEQCPEGMSCAFNSSVFNYGTTFAAPVLLPSFYSEASDPLSVYWCKGSSKGCNCPGGSPGTCHDGRVGLMCNTCPAGQVRTRCGCSECSSVSLSLLSVMPIAFLAICTGLYYGSNSKLHVKASISLTLSIFLGIIVTILQTFGTLNELPMPWPDTQRSSFKMLSLLFLNFEYMSTECFFGGNPVVSYGIRCLLPFSGIVAVFFLHGCSRLFHLCGRSHLVWNTDKMWNTVGTTLQSFYISVVTIAVLPLQCYPNPNGTRSMMGAMQVLCWTGDHLPFMFFGSVVFLTIGLGFLTLCVWVIMKAPVECHSVRFSRRYRFILYRFRPEVWYWGLVVTIRQVALAFASALPADDDHALATYLVFFLVLYLVCQVKWWPWKNAHLNYVEASFFACTVWAIVGDTAFMQRVQVTYEEAHIATLWFFISLILAVAVAFSALVSYAWWKSRSLKAEFMPTPNKDCLLLAEAWVQMCERSLALGTDGIARAVRAMNPYDHDIMSSSLRTLETLAPLTFSTCGSLRSKSNRVVSPWDLLRFSLGTPDLVQADEASAPTVVEQRIHAASEQSEHDRLHLPWQSNFTLTHVRSAQ